MKFEVYKSSLEINSCLKGNGAHFAVASHFWSIALSGQVTGGAPIKIKIFSAKKINFFVPLCRDDQMAVIRINSRQAKGLAGRH